jgi:hypothetical protein
MTRSERVLRELYAAARVKHDEAVGRHDHADTWRYTGQMEVIEKALMALGVLPCIYPAPTNCVPA